MKIHRILPVAALAILSLSTPSNAAEKSAKPTKAAAIYFGNSLCENSVPWFHPTLAASAGKELKVNTAFGPGWQLWMHLDDFLKNPEGLRKNLVNPEFDTLILHVFGSSPLLDNNVRESVFDNQKFDEPRDASDFATAVQLIDRFLEVRPDDPNSRIFIYTSWPGVPAAGDVAKRVQEETEKSLLDLGKPREEVLKAVKERKATFEELEPVLKEYDFPALWLASYERNDETPWASKFFHSRDYYTRLMELLKAKYPDLWEQGRLAVFPHGDVFLALDEKMRAGKVPGLTNIGLFSRDGLHVRGGLPRYTLAATCYAVMFGEHPSVLDASIYNDIENYKNENIVKMKGIVGAPYVHFPDVGEILVITPELKKIVDDTVWEVVTKHPYTQVSAK